MITAADPCRRTPGWQAAWSAPSALPQSANPKPTNTPDLALLPAQADAKLVHSLDIIASFAALNVEVPLTAAKVPAALDTVAARRCGSRPPLLQRMHPCPLPAPPRREESLRLQRWLRHRAGRQRLACPSAAPAARACFCLGAAGWRCVRCWGAVDACVHSAASVSTVQWEP